MILLAILLNFLNIITLGSSQQQFPMTDSQIPRVAAVTGANQGIGFAIVRNLALDYASSPLKSGPFTIYLTARSPERGAQAMEDMNKDPQLKKAKVLAIHGGDTTISYHALDITSGESIRTFRDYLRQEHPSGIDVFINSAGIRIPSIAMQGFNSEVVEQTLRTNYYGTLEATTEMLPLLRKGGRMVNIASMAGHLNKYSDAVRDDFLKAADSDVAAVTAIMQRFQNATDAGRVEVEGFPKAAYCVSKAGEIGFTKVIAMEEESRGNGILVNSCCPGFVSTNMTKHRGGKTPDQGAKTPVMLALQDLGGRTGEFWQNEKVQKW